jgi:phosphate-selective porin
MRRLIWCTIIALAFGAAAARAQTPAPQPSGDSEKDSGGVRWVWDDRPSLRVGKVFRVDFRAKFHVDLRASEWEHLEDEGGTFEFTRKRVGVEGELTRYIEFEVEAEMRKENPWRDVFVNVKPAAAFEVQAGKFKMPFSYDQTTGEFSLDFISRSLVGRQIAPGRDIGVMAHGRLFRRILVYEIGAFRHDGENAEIEPGFLEPGEEFPDEHGAAARLTVQPLRHAGVGDAYREMHVAVAYTTSSVPEGLNSVSGESVLGYQFFEPVYTLGARRRFGTEFVWMPGPVGIKAEYIRTSEQRRGQGLGDVDLTDFHSSGWYVSGTWAITGEPKADGIEPKRPLFAGGFGALEVGVRYDELGFFSGSSPEEPFRNPRADNVLENRDRVWTVGVTWYLNKWGKIQLNGIHESFADPERSPNPGQAGMWTAACRLQFVM